MDNPIKTRSVEFALKMVRLGKRLMEERKEFILSKQLIRSATSVGANIAEAQYGQSRADFTAKMSIALKEAAETKYWIELLVGAGYLSEEEAGSILTECLEIEKTLCAIVNSSKKKKAKPPTESSAA